MTKVFVSGSIKIKNLDGKVLERLKNIVESKYCVIVGDADGVDSSVQEFLKEQHADSVVVYCSGEKPRNNIGSWTTKSISAAGKPGTREYFTAKDKVMAEDCDYGFMVWDASSTGTLSNALELISRRKAALVYINKAKQFIKVKDARDIEGLLRFMSDAALKKADKRISLLRKVESMKFTHDDLFAAQLGAPADGPPSASLRQSRG
jgi:hypothetical protein